MPVRRDHLPKPLSIKVRERNLFTKVLVVAQQMLPQGIGHHFIHVHSNSFHNFPNYKPMSKRTDDRCRNTLHRNRLALWRVPRWIVIQQPAAALTCHHGFVVAAVAQFVPALRRTIIWHAMHFWFSASATAVPLAFTMRS